MVSPSQPNRIGAVPSAGDFGQPQPAVAESARLQTTLVAATVGIARVGSMRMKGEYELRSSTEYMACHGQKHQFHRAP